MMTSTILIIEDEPKVASFIQQGLAQNDYVADIASDGKKGLEAALRGNYLAIILDLNLPLINGLEVCREIRKANVQSPVLMLTALGTTDDKLIGFESGADDYLVKPFEFRELLARVRALMKRGFVKNEENRKLRVADLELDTEAKTVYRGKNEITLTAKEFALLEYLMKNEGKVISRNELAEKIWDINFDTGTNIIDVYINFLRKKIDKSYSNKLIHTNIGMGYVLKEMKHEDQK